MSLSYAPLWKMLDELNISKMDFARMIDISNATLAKLGKDEPVTLTIIDRICTKFSCKIEDVVKHVVQASLVTPNFLAKKGMIVLAIDMLTKDDLEKVQEKLPDGTEHTFYVPKKSAFVILDVLSPDLDTDPEKIANAKYESLTYLIAPISTSFTPHFFTAEFKNAEINGENTDGTVIFGRMRRANGSIFEKIIGYMPEYYVEKFEKMAWNFINIAEENE